MNQSTIESVRLDKWLWAARFYKTRAVAREMIEGGKVHYNGQRAKPGKIVEVLKKQFPTCQITVTTEVYNDERTVEIMQISSQRKGAPEAQFLYCETVESIEQREKMAQARKMNALTMPHPERRPDKKERRTLLKFKQTNSHESS